MFQPRPHGVIAVDPLLTMHTTTGGMSTARSHRNLWSRTPVLELQGVVCSLGEQPIPEHHDIGKCRRHLRADAPIRLGQAELLAERTYEPPIDQIGGRRCRASQRDPLTVDGRIDHHARAIEHRSACRLVCFYAGGIEPLRPVPAVIEMNEPELEDISGFRQAITACK
jgi:hypothetical protein